MDSPVLYNQSYSGYGGNSGQKPKRHCIWADGQRYDYVSKLRTYAHYYPGKYGERGGYETLDEHLKKKSKGLRQAIANLSARKPKKVPPEQKRRQPYSIVSGVRVPKCKNGMFPDGTPVNEFDATDELLDNYDERRAMTIAALRRGDEEEAYEHACLASEYAFGAFIFGHMRGELTDELTEEIADAARNVDSVIPTPLYDKLSEEQIRFVANSYIRLLPASEKSLHLSDQFTSDYHALPREQKLPQEPNKHGAKVMIDGYISSVFGDKSQPDNPYHPEIFREALVRSGVDEKEIAKYDRAYNRYEHDTKHFDPLSVLNSVSRGRVVSYLFQQNIDGAVDLLQTRPEIFRDTSNENLFKCLKALKDENVPLELRNNIAQRYLEYAAVRDDKKQRNYQKELAGEIRDLYSELKNLYAMERKNEGIPSFSRQHGPYLSEDDADYVLFNSVGDSDTDDLDKKTWTTALNKAKWIFDSENVSYLDKAYVYRRIVGMAKYKTDASGDLDSLVYTPPLTEEAKKNRNRECVNLCALLEDKRRKARQNE